MPDISEDARRDIETRLASYVSDRPGYALGGFVGAGGSAAIYRVATPAGVRAIKVFDSRFFSESNAKAQRRRLELQKTLVGHKCGTLVRVFDVLEAYGTGFVEMEFVEWPSLKDVLPSTPDEKIPTLINQLVTATRYLETLDIVHRDIKPENIHVSPDFSQLKLIDLGVARLLSASDEEGDDGTDHGQKRPFIATAQYSSPEYLFRLDAPSPDLWLALNFYQIGAVLHDLINKKPLFEYEVGLGNKWLVARAVLSKTPHFPDSDPTRLIHLKALAARCLAKDMATRLTIVGWSDFASEAPVNAVSELKAKLARGRGLASANVASSQAEKLRFERDQFVRGFCQDIRNRLIPALDGAIPIILTAIPETGYIFEFAVSQSVALMSRLSFEWNIEMQPMTATIMLSGQVRSNNAALTEPSNQPFSVVTIGASDEVMRDHVANKLASMIGAVVDMIGATADSLRLHGADVLSGSLVEDADGH